MATEVVAPDGVRWRVRRRWLGGRSLPRWRGMDGGDLGGSLFDAIGAGGDNILGAIAFFLALAALVALLVFFVLPLAILLVELLVFLVLVGLGIAARVVLRRPWLLEATDGVMTRRWLVPGWRDSRDALAEIAAALERGDAQVLPTAAVASVGPGRR